MQVTAHASVEEEEREHQQPRGLGEPTAGVSAAAAGAALPGDPDPATSVLGPREDVAAPATGCGVRERISANWSTGPQPVGQEESAPCGLEGECGS